MSADSERPPSVALPLALLGLGLLVFIAVLGVWAFGTTIDGPSGQRCEITPAGEAFRQTNGVGETDQLADGTAGDRYSSTSGCAPFDDGVPSGP